MCAWRPLSEQVPPPLVTKSAARFDPQQSCGQV
jgi:hypothetical protein